MENISIYIERKKWKKKEKVFKKRENEEGVVEERENEKTIYSRMQ